MASVQGQAVVISKAGGPFEVVERSWSDPGRGEVRVKVEACGVCHSDVFVKEGSYPGVTYPRIPGHEIAGTIDAVGEGVRRWRVGDRVGIGWLGSYCGYCDPCRKGEFVLCQNQQVTGLHRDGGYADYVIVSETGLASVPRELESTAAGPLMCAGITVFNSLRNSGARMGDTVAVLGLGGLGHLGVQFAAKAGFRTIALTRGREKAQLALDLGAHQSIDTSATDPAEALTALGGADIILSTVTSTQAVAQVIGGLAADGRLIILGVSQEPLTVHSAMLIGKRQGLAGWASGSARDSEDTLSFSALNDVRPMIETFPLSQASEAYERMVAGKARFRAVLVTNGSAASRGNA